MKQKESLNRKDWTPYKMKSDITPIILVVGIISYSFMSYYTLSKIINFSNLTNTLLVIVGVVCGFIALKYIYELMEYIR